MTTKPRRGLWCFMLLMLGSCADMQPIMQELNALRTQLELHNKRFSAVEHELQAGLLAALCRPEMRVLLEDVRAECKKAEPGQNASTAMCETKQIQPAIFEADPEHKGRFLKFMSMLRHETFYMKRGATEVMKFRRERLAQLTAQPVLKNTSFLVVVHPGVGDLDRNIEALRRAKVISDKMKHYNSDIDDDRISTWIYEFPVGRGEIDNPMDRPSPGEPTDLKMGVWVFRADC